MSNQKQGLGGMSTEELTQNLAMITLDRLGLESQIETTQNSLVDAKKGATDVCAGTLSTITGSTRVRT